MQRCNVLAITFLGLLAGLSQAQDATKLPRGPQPQMLFISSVDAKDGAIVITQAVMEAVPVEEERVRVQGGVTEKYKVTTYKFVTKLVKQPFVLKDHQFQLAGGQKLSAEEALKRLTPGKVVLLSVDGTPIDPAFLKIIKDDTLILVRQPPAPGK
jgi:hypothetical protein